LSPYEYLGIADAAFAAVKRQVIAQDAEYVRLGANDPLRWGFDRGFDAGYRAAKLEESARWPEQHFDATTHVKAP